MLVRLSSLILVLCLPVCGWAMQVREVGFISPVTGRKFVALAAPLSQSATEAEGNLADMGTDDDGCRHSSNISEYERYVITDPTSYFSAMAIEWDDSGKFGSPLSTEFKDWVIKRYNTEFFTDWNHAFDTAREVASKSGQLPPDRATFVMTQESIPVDKRFAYACECYEKRGARPAVIAKLALTAAWAIRTRLQYPVADPRLAGGFEEVNDKVLRKVKDGETFSFEKWYGSYKEIFAGTRLTPAGSLIAGQVLFGFELRRGDIRAADAVLEELMGRFKANADNSEGLEFHRGLVRTFRRHLTGYRQFLELAAINFRKAITDEEFTRVRLPEPLLAMGECMRRSGRDSEALDWYMCLARLSETQPKLRDDIRAEGKVPSANAPYLVQLGWIADQHVAALKKSLPAHPDEPNGTDAGLINAILFDGLGTLEYQNPMWKPTSGAETQASAFVLDLIGKGILLYHDRLDGWPESLGELWMSEIIHDRNRVNRFHCPVTGAPFAYSQPPPNAAERTVLIATSQPVPTKDGPRFIAYLANNTVAWTETAPQAGSILLK